MSTFRLICIAALTAAIPAFAAGAAAAQSAAATDQSEKSYLAGLRPPHEHHKPGHAKTGQISTQHQTKHPPITAKNSKAHRPARLADKINSRVSWPSVEPVAADERIASQTVLQFATEDAAPAPAAESRPTPAPATPTAKPAPPAKIAAMDERSNVDSAGTDKPSAASTVVRTERFEAPAPSQMRVIVPAPIEASVTASIPKDQSPARSSSSTAQTLATLAGAITACVVGGLMIGFGSVRPIKCRQI